MKTVTRLRIPSSPFFSFFSVLIFKRNLKIISVSKIQYLLILFQEELSVGWLTQAQVDLHHLDDRERMQLQNWAKSLLIETITMHNQSIQLDPVVAYMRILARLKKKGDPEFAAIVNTINELKALAKMSQLTSRLLYMLVKPYIKLEEAPQLMKLVEEFIQNLIVNNLFNTLVGPPATLICHEKLHEEQIMWPDYLTLCFNQNAFMDDDLEHPTKTRIKWIAENHLATITLSAKLDAKSTNLWQEFVGFNHIMSKQIYADMKSPHTTTFDWKKIQDWGEKELKNRLIAAKEIMNSFTFYYPVDLEWLTMHTPRWNQSIMLATAYPPVVVDMSTEKGEYFRRPPQWSTFPQFHQRLNVVTKNLRHSHAFEVMFQ